MSTNDPMDQFLIIHNRLCTNQETIGRTKERIFSFKVRIEDPYTAYLPDNWGTIQNLKFLKVMEERNLKTLLEQKIDLQKDFDEKLITLLRSKQIQK